MRARPLFMLAAIAASISLYSQRPPSNNISREDSERWMKFLASDSLEGRRTGSEGNNIAARYIREEALSIGLTPLPECPDMFQPLEYIRVTPVADSSIVTLTDSSGTRIFSDKVFPLFPPTGNISLEGDIVFAGYGFMNSKENYNDFTSVKVTDRIVIIMTRTPDLEGSGMPASGATVDEMTEIRKLPMLILQKARAVIFVADPGLNSDLSDGLLSIGGTYQLVPLFRKKGMSLSLNAFMVSAHTADHLLARTGLSLEDLQDSIASTKQPVSFTFPDTRAQISVRVDKDTVTSSNVIAYVEGSDPVLKNECVIYTAHYDHVGMDRSGNIYNGANDNASGTVGLLNVAREFASLPKKPSRSVVFLWTTGEEEGLHGSSYYVENPLFPLDKTVAEINFDMIGRSRRDTDIGASLTGQIDITGPDTIKIVSAGESSSFVALTREACLKSGLYPIDEGKGDHYSGSDHYPFHINGIPAVFFFTGLHRDYHQPTDDFEFIDFDKLVKVSRAGFITGYKVAAANSRPFIDKPDRQ